VPQALEEIIKQSKNEDEELMMPSLKKSKVKSSRRGLPAGLTIAVLALMLLLGPAGAAQASTVSIKLDGILDGSPPYSNSRTVEWFNGHKPAPDSIYGDFNNQLGTTTIHYGTGELAGETSGDTYFFLYVEVPLYAKNMIWQANPGDGLTEADLGSYRVHHETHHNPGDLQLNFHTATGSEKLVLNDSNGNEQFKANLAGNADNEFGLVGFKDSVDYLFDNSLATEALSLERDTKMSFEFQFDLDSDQNNALLALFDNGIEFHLSPERGLQPVVPIPGAVWLLGSGLIGLAGIRRRFRK
jgi:hypothetical protein